MRNQNPLMTVHWLHIYIIQFLSYLFEFWIFVIGSLFSSIATFTNKASVLYVKWRKKFVAWGEFIWFFCSSYVIQDMIFSLLLIPISLFGIRYFLISLFSCYSIWWFVLMTIWSWDWKMSLIEMRWYDSFFLFLSFLPSDYI